MKTQERCKEMERLKSHWVGAAVCVLGAETVQDAGGKGGQTSAVVGVLFLFLL